MPLPTPTRTWTWTTNQRFTNPGDLQGTTKSILYLVKTAILAMPGVTVKGSSIGATSSMDGVDRWTSSTVLGRTTARGSLASTWIVFKAAHMGTGGTDAEIMLANVDTGNNSVSALITFSPLGQFAVASTATPSATIECSVGSTSTASINLHPTSTTFDRIVHVATSTDGKGIFILLARGGTANFFASIQVPVSAVTSPASFSPALCGFSCAPGGAIANSLANFLTMANANNWNGQAYVHNGTTGAIVAMLGGCEAYGGTSSAVARQTFVPELQGSGMIVQDLSVWTETGTHRGKIGNLVDIWAAPSVLVDASTFPADATRQFISWGPVIVPWNGSVPLMT